MRVATSGIVTAFLLIAFVFAQEQRRFDVASVRILSTLDDAPQPLALNPRRVGERLSWTTTLYRLLRYAYQLQDWRVVGIKESVYCFIDTRLTLPATPDDARAMLRQLLRERFRLTAHTRTEERAGYALVVSKGGSKLKTVSSDGTSPAMPDYLPSPPGAYEGFAFASLEGKGIAAITGRGVPVSELSDLLSQELGTFVLDKTGLQGKFYFGFTFQRIDYLNTDAPDAPTLDDALEERLGLRLEKQRGPVELLVVDSIAKTPTQN